MEKVKENQVEMGNLERKGMSLEVFSDASVVNVDEGKSQIGYVTGLVDEKRGKCPVTWKSKIGKRVAH